VRAAGLHPIVLPKVNMKVVRPPKGAFLLGADTLSEALSILLKK
jgi:hypothetical protein